MHTANNPAPGGDRVRCQLEWAQIWQLHPPTFRDRFAHARSRTLGRELDRPVASDVSRSFVSARRRLLF